MGRINEKIGEMNTGFFKKSGMRGLVIDGTGLGYNTPIAMRVMGGIRKVSGYIKVVLMVGIS